ncbi:MAG: hypothetical protein U0Y10_27105 [Spirosomataceae bacterium]
MKGLIDFKADYYYHIVNHAVGSENLFRTSENYRYFLERYAHHTDTVFETFAYCLMPNHFHLLVKIKPLEVFQKDANFKNDVHKYVMQKLSNWLNGYAKAYNIRFGRKGALFVDYTKRFLVDSDSYFTATVNYIHQNPVNHGFVKELKEWNHSSYHSIVSDKATRLKRNEVIDWFGGKQKFEHFHQQNSVPLDPSFEY